MTGRLAASAYPASRHGRDLAPDDIVATGSQLVARLANTFTGDVEEPVVDQVVGDYGTAATTIKS